MESLKHIMKMAQFELSGSRHRMMAGGSCSVIGMVGVQAGMGAGAGNLEEDAAFVAGWAGPITCCKLRSWVRDCGCVCVVCRTMVLSSVLHVWHNDCVYSPVGQWF